MRYSVRIGYNRFVFFDGKEALAFVTIAVGHMVGLKDYAIITVTKEEEKEENSNGMDV